MDRNRVKHAAEVESSASQGAGLLELWHGAGQVMWHHAGLCRLSVASGQVLSRACCNACANGVIAEDKKGDKRRELEVCTCFGPLLQWILRWPAIRRDLALALDATTLKKRFTVLVISVVYRGCAIRWLESGGCARKGSLATSLDGAVEKLRTRCQSSGR